MDFHAVGTFTLMVLLLTIMPGPNGAHLLRTVPHNDRRASILNLAGIVTAFFGSDIVDSEHPRHKNFKEFIEWAAAYDTCGLDMRSKASHEKWT